MSILNPVSIMFRAKIMGVVERAEDPHGTLAHACQRPRPSSDGAIGE